MKADPKNFRLRSLAIFVASRLLVAIVALSFFATLLSIGAAADASGTMPCCVGKTEGHCDSGLLTPKPPEPDPEPMCGLTSPVKAAGVVVADKADTESQVSHHSSSSTIPAIESPAVEQQCQMECGACATATSRHKREKSVILARTAHIAPSITIERRDDTTILFSSNRNWTPTSPRGPPASLLSSLN